MVGVDVGIQIVADAVAVGVSPFLSLQGPGVFSVEHSVVVIIWVQVIGDSVLVGIDKEVAQIYGVSNDAVPVAIRFRVVRASEKNRSSPGESTSSR